MVQVLVVSAGEAQGTITDIEDDLDTLRGIVGGDITELHFDDGLMILNELAGNLQVNARASEIANHIVYGTVILAGGADEEGNLLSYTP